ncbi:MAG: PKD domain-containing protein [Prolixibacteraceae bacterium]|nr:PKD domain-containing protein [Prolixibacteraceae bacterium]
MNKMIPILLAFLVVVGCDRIEKPIACFEFQSLDSINGAIQFTNCSENSDQYFWDFGQGKTSTETNPSMLLDLDFPIVVSLIAQNEVGADTLVLSIEEDDLELQPVPLFTHQLEYRNELLVVFNNQSMFADRFEWDFGDGKQSTEQNPVHAYGRWGNFEVKLKAIANNKEQLFTKTIEVVDSFHTHASFYVALNENNVKEAHFFNTTRFGKTFTWDFGDGTSSTEKSPVHQYAEYGHYRVKLSAKNEYSSQDIYSTIKVLEPHDRVTACFEFEVDESDSFLVRFINCSENATDFEWFFSDNTYSTEENPVHTFPHTNDGLFAIVKMVAFNDIDSEEVYHCIPDECEPVGKPNVYLYPTEPLQLQVEVNFPKGGQITASVPEYGSGWDVYVQPDGLIDYRYDYLFYESTQISHFQHTHGWCVAKADLETFFRSNMALYQFNENEINDFVKYWVPRLNFSEYYKIYPQTNVLIDEAIELKFSVQPDNIIRLFYGIYPSDSHENLPPPSIPHFKREGFVLTEWGVFQ